MAFRDDICPNTSPDPNSRTDWRLEGYNRSVQYLSCLFLHRFKVGDNYFVRGGSAPTVTVKKGTTVRWVWAGRRKVSLAGPGSSNGYGKAMNAPLAARSSGSMPSGLSPFQRWSPSVTA